MKKVKVMLTVTVVLGTVGGVLAFKAKRTVEYCTAPTVNGGCPANYVCPNGALNQKVTAVGGVTKCYVEIANTANCAINQPLCTGRDRITNN
jgi:hypothetical protein